MSVPTATLGDVDQYLYRLSGSDGLLYIGVSDDWTRRLREHWHVKDWAADITSVTLENFPDRRAVLSAERKAIKSEKPLYNIQHNNSLPDREEAAACMTAADIAALVMLLLAAGCMIYALSQAAITKYRDWKADHDAFREWQRTRDSQTPAPDPEHPTASTETPPTSAVTPLTPAATRGIGFIAAFYTTLPHPPQAGG
jgi:predicted GIY-YIG superfamily endonuclease